MKTDPAELTTMEWPPVRGRGSSREGWVRFAYKLADVNRNLAGLVKEQSEAIRERDAEIVLLRRQIAARKPKGGRPRLADERVSEIEAELAAGGGSRRAIATRFGVSAMTVSRIAARVAARATTGAVGGHTL